MATNLGSCDFLFDNETYVESVPEKFACPICLCQVQRDAHLTVCCGHHFCFQCIDVVGKDGKPCPMCKASVHIFPNKERQRDIKLLKVRCAVGQESSDKKCEWSGELGKLAPHAKEQHGVTLDGWLMAMGQSHCTSQYSPQPRNASRPTPRPPATSQPSPRPSSQPPVTSQSSAAAQPGPRLVRIAKTPFQCSPQLHRPLPQPSPQAPPTSHSRPTGQFVLHPLSPSRASTNRSKCSGRAQFHMKQTHPSPPPPPPPVRSHSKSAPRHRTSADQRGQPSHVVTSHQHVHITVSTTPTAPRRDVSKGRPRPPRQADNEYVHLPSGDTRKVHRRKDGSKFYNDKGTCQSIEPHRNKPTISRAASATTATPATPRQRPRKKAATSQQVHLESGMTLTVHQEGRRSKVKH